jgi:uridine phosphorylase
MFETGVAFRVIQEVYETVSIIDKLPCLLYPNKTPCLQRRRHPNVNFVQGGFGAPAAVDTFETLIALGTKVLLVFGLCGGIGSDVQVGDLIIPTHIAREEGTSHHYLEPSIPATPHRPFMTAVSDYVHQTGQFQMHYGKTVSTDGVYRQTRQKELHWREQGVLGVDMEASALLAVAQYYHIPAACVLMVSDKHPLDAPDVMWQWGNGAFDALRQQAIRCCVEMMSHLATLEFTDIGNQTS